MADDLFAMIYRSRPVVFSFEEVDDILAASRRNNPSAGITGMLVYDHEAYVQVLEGPRAALQATSERIFADDRHHRIDLISTARLSDRLFPEWAMAAALTQETTVRSLRLVDHVRLERFDPFEWSRSDATEFVLAMAQEMHVRHYAAPSQVQVVPSRPSRTSPAQALDEMLDKMAG